MKKTEYVLFTHSNEYVVEYLLKQLVLSKSITEALTFDDFYVAMGFKDLLLKDCKLDCSVNTYIQ